jgi:hypothetical protein
LCHNQILEVDVELVTDNDWANAFELDDVRSR